MKRLLTITVLGISMVNFTNSSFCGFWKRGNKCHTEQRCAESCQTSCVATCEKSCEVPPICTKTVMENKIIQVPKVVRVPARKFLVPQPDIIERIPQPARKIVIPQPPIPQPAIIKYECVPDKIVCKKQEPLVRYECPVGTNENPGCAQTTCVTETCCR